MQTTMSPRPTIIRRSSLLAAAFGLAAAASAPGPVAAQIACGDILQKGTTTMLTQDIGPCDGFDYALGLDGAVLDLNGHTFFCADTAGDGVLPDGIVLFDKKSELRNGTVRGCYDNVFLAGKGKHLVENVTSRDAANDGFYIQPNSNKSLLFGTRSTANADDGYEIRGNRNRIEASTADANGEDGIDIAAGKANLITGNTVAGNADAGIDVDGPATRILGNTITGSGAHGVEIGGRRNTVIGNTVTGSAAGPDIVARTCRGNRFEDNVVTTPGACVP